MRLAGVLRPGATSGMPGNSRFRNNSGKRDIGNALVVKTVAGRATRPVPP
jgi:hypothetical protein